MMAHICEHHENKADELRRWGYEFKYLKEQFQTLVVNRDRAIPGARARRCQIQKDVRVEAAKIVKRRREEHRELLKLGV